MASLGRDYQAPNIKVGDSGQYTQAQVANSDTRVLPSQLVGDNTWKDRLLEQFGKQATQFATKAAENEITNQYLEGQAAAGVVKSEEELQGNPLTRDWKVAGYRDTMGKLALADNDAKFSLDIKHLREQGPEALQGYLAKRRVDLEPVLGSMSREARAASAGQLLLQDRTATAKWTTEHTKFITEQKVQALTTSFSVANKALAEARLGTLTDGEQGKKNYQEALRNTMGLLVGATWMDSGLPDDVKQAHTLNSISLALANDNVELYDYLNANAAPDEHGGTSTLISRLASDDQIKLAGQYRESMQRNADVRNLAYHEQLAKVDSEITAGTFAETYDNYNSTLKAMVVNKIIGADEYQTRLTKYTDMKLKGERTSLAATATLNGDKQALDSMGMTEEQGVNAVQDQMVKAGIPPAQQLNRWLTAGQHGSRPSYKKAGELVGFAVRQMATAKDGEILSQHMEIFKAASTALGNLAGDARSVARVDMLSGMAEEDRLFATQVFALVDANTPYSDAVQVARKTYETNAKLSPSAKAAMATIKAADVEKAVKEIEPQGFFGTLWSTLRGGSANAISPKVHALDDLKAMNGSALVKDVFGTHTANQIMSDNARTELRLEAQNVQLVDPTASSDRVIETAMANLASRGIPTASGMLIPPAGTDVGKMFGVGKANTSAIGPAIDLLLKPTKAGSKWTLSFDEGRIITQEYGSNGERLGLPKYLDVQQVRDQIALTDREKSLKASWIYGRGRTVGSPSASGKIKNADGTDKVATLASSKAAVTYNGDSTSGAPAEWVYDFRTNLVNHEGVSSKPYKDLSGKLDAKGNPIMTVGVGVSSHNPNFPQVEADGTVSPENISNSFRAASDEAAHAGVTLAKSTGRFNKSGFQLMSELAYQSGTNFVYAKDSAGKPTKSSMAYQAFVNSFTDHDWGVRVDGSPKQNGFLGILRDKNGRPVTEYGIGVHVNGVETEVPSLVPTLSKEQIQSVLNGVITKDIERLAIDHATKRIAEGKSPFASNIESAQAAFKHTAAWFWSKGNSDELTPRQKSYLSLIENAMKGH